VIKRVAVIKLGVNSGTGDGGASSEIDMDRYSEAEEYLMVIAGLGDIWDLVKNVRCSSNMKPRFPVECVVLSEELWILPSCLLRPLSRNLVLVKFSVRRFAVVIQGEIRFRAFWRRSMLESR